MHKCENCGRLSAPIGQKYCPDCQSYLSHKRPDLFGNRNMCPACGGSGKSGGFCGGPCPTCGGSGKA